jgi:hypothetical protein
MRNRHFSIAIFFKTRAARQEFEPTMFAFIVAASLAR